MPEGGAPVGGITAAAITIAVITAAGLFAANNNWTGLNEFTGGILLPNIAHTFDSVIVGSDVQSNQTFTTPLSGGIFGILGINQIWSGLDEFTQGILLPNTARTFDSQIVGSNVASNQTFTTPLLGGTFGILGISGQTWTGTNYHTAAIVGGQLTYPATFPVYVNGSNFSEKNSTNNILLTSSNAATLIQDAITRSGNFGTVYLEPGTYPVNTPLNMTYGSSLRCEFGSIIQVPSGYARPVIQFSGGGGGTNTGWAKVVGCHLKEASTIKSLWTGIQLNAATGGGTVQNYIALNKIESPHVGIELNGTTNKFANSNIIENNYVTNYTRGIGFNFTNTHSVGVDGFDRNYFGDDTFQAGTMTQSCVNNVEHTGNDFVHIMCYDNQLNAAYLGTIINYSAVNTHFIGGYASYKAYVNHGTNSTVLDDSQGLTINQQINMNSTSSTTGKIVNVGPLIFRNFGACTPVGSTCNPQIQSNSALQKATVTGIFEMATGGMVDTNTKFYLDGGTNTYFIQPTNAKQINGWVNGILGFNLTQTTGKFGFSGNYIKTPTLRENETFAVQPQSNFTSGQNGGNSTATSSTSIVMSGNYLTITPQVTGNIRISLTGQLDNSVLNDGCQYDIRESTSNMGANGAAATGTVVGNNVKLSDTLASGNMTASMIVGKTGLAVGTKTFWDVGIKVLTGGSCALRNVNWLAQEY